MAGWNTNAQEARKLHGYDAGIDSAEPTDGGTTENWKEEGCH